MTLWCDIKLPSLINLNIRIFTGVLIESIDGAKSES